MRVKIYFHIYTGAICQVWGLSFSLQIIGIEPVLLGLLSAEKTIGM